MLMMMSFLEGDKWKRCEYIREGGEVMYVNSILKIEKVSESGYYYIFSFQGMREIELCLNTNYDRAMKLYKKVGFEEKACLQHYIIE